LSGKNKATLIPIAILVDGKFYDASAYKADPVPMALEGGTVYEAEQAGVSQGLFTIGGALHSRNPGSANPWVATGSYVAQGTEAPKTKLKAEDVPVGIDSSGDAPPRLTRGSGGATQGTAGSGASPATASSSPAASGSSDKASVPASAPASGPSSSGTSSGKGEQKSAASAGSSEKTAGTDAKSGEQAGNYYRPTLRRGKPTDAAPEEKEEAPIAGKGEKGDAKAASQEPVQVVAAISDAGGPDPRPYTFFWKTGEEDERRQQMLDLAGNEVRAYLNARAKNAIGVKQPGAKAKPARKASAKVTQPAFENIHFQAFDVWANNQPVMILSADAHLPVSAAGVAAPDSYSITVVARTDIYGSLRKLYAGVTDKFHLDVTPRLELIDAVDADGDGRGELLFRETTDAGSGYLIYRATADNLWKMFDSLGME
jgi:hypothetical protein